MASASTKRDKQKGQAIQVFIRQRPLNTQEREVGSANVIEILNSKELAVRQQYGKRYSFDKVFGPSSTQMDIYGSVVHPMISEVIAGYNCTVFAYGQTGTGKTFTMAGGSEFSSEVAWQDNMDAGIIPRALSNLFDELNLIKQPYTVRVSYLELYNEELFDLLSHTVDSKSIRLFEDQHQKGSVIIQGITKETVCNKRQVYEILAKGQEKRRTASTLLNAQSSRSHTVFSIMVHTCETTPDGDEIVKTGKLNLVDLAGSENIGRSGATDRRAREAGNINQSLLTLGRVIKALVERTAHIPYRESKLTRILQDSLGGRTKTSIIATISPAAICLEETLSTLDYANRARNITNRPEVNQIVSQKTWKELYENELQTLRQNLEAARTGCGVVLAQENYDRLVHDSTIFKEELANKITLVRELEQQVRNMEEEKQLHMAEWEQLQLSFAATRTKLAAYREKLKQTTEEKKTEEYLASCYENKTQVLHNQAQILLGATKQTTANFRKKIDDLCSISRQNNEAVRKVTQTVTQKYTALANELDEFAVSANTCSESAVAILNIIADSHKESADMGLICSDALAEKARKILHVVCRDFQGAYEGDKDRNQTSVRKLQNKVNTVQQIKALIHADLDENNKDAESTFVDLRNDLTKQEEINKEMVTELKGVSKDLLSIMTRIELLELKVSQSQETTKNCMEKLAAAHKLSQEKHLKVSSSIGDANRVATDALTVIDEMKEMGSGVHDTLQQLQTCRRNFEIRPIENDTELTTQSCMSDVSGIATGLKEDNDRAQFTFTSNTSKLSNCLREFNVKMAEFKSAAISKISECQEDLSNCVNRCLIDPTAAEGTPARIPFDAGAMAVTPKEQILKRFHEVRSKKGLEFDDSLLSSPEQLPESDPESAVPPNIVSPHIEHLKSADKAQKPQEPDILNMPGPSGDPCG